MHAISSYRGNRPTNKQTHTHKPTDRTDYNTLRRSFASAQCNNVVKWKPRTRAALRVYSITYSVSVCLSVCTDIICTSRRSHEWRGRSTTKICWWRSIRTHQLPLIKRSHSRKALITISFTAVVICESSRRSAGLLADIRVTFVTDSLHKRPLFYMFQVHSKLHFIM